MKLLSAIASAAVLCVAAPAFAATTVVTFETATSFASIAEYYNGGADSSGAVGPALGISFGGDALGLQNDDPAFPFFSNAPSAIGVMAPVGAESTMNVAAGFGGTFSFYYSSSDAALGAVQVWSGLNGTGSLLASFNLLGNATAGCSDSAFCHFDQLSGVISGTAYSVTFGNAANLAAFDNVSVNVNVAAVPEPATTALMGLGLAGLAFVARRRRA